MSRPHEVVFDLSKEHVFDLPKQLTIRGGESQQIEEAVGGAETYSFFRVTVTANNGDANFMGIRELELRLNGVNQVPGNIIEATANAFVVNLGPAEAFDESYVAGDGWVAAATFPAWLMIELVTAIEIDSYAIGGYSTATSPEPRSSRDWILEGSSDGVDWVTLDQQAGISWTGHDFTTPKVFILD